MSDPVFIDATLELDEQATSYAPAEERSVLHAGALVFFDGALDRLDVVRAVARAAYVHPELRTRPTTLPIASDLFAWTRDPSFRGSKHVEVVEIDDAEDEAALAAAVSRIWSQPLPVDRPPWQLTLFSDRDGVRTTVLLRAHGTLAHGFGLGRLAAVLLGTPRDATPPRVPSTAPRDAGVLPAVLRAVSALADEGARRSRALASEVRTMLRPGIALARTREVGRILESAGTLLSSPAPETPWNATLGSERRVAWLSLSRDVLRGIHDALGGDWQDAWLTIVADALGRTLRQRGRSTIGLTLLAYVPSAEPAEQPPTDADTPPSSPAVAGDGAPRAAAPVAREAGRLIGLPVDEMSPAARHGAIVASRLDPLSAARGNGLEQLARLSRRLPSPLQSLLGSLCYQAANTMLYADAGPDAPVVLAGRTATRIVPLAGLPWQIGVALAALEWQSDELTVGVTVDAALVPDVDSIVHALHEAYVEVSAAAGVPPVDPLRRRAH